MANTNTETRTNTSVLITYEAYEKLIYQSFVGDVLFDQVINASLHIQCQVFKTTQYLRAEILFSLHMKSFIEQLKSLSKFYPQVTVIPDILFLTQRIREIYTIPSTEDLLKHMQTFHQLVFICVQHQRQTTTKQSDDFSNIFKTYQIMFEN